MTALPDINADPSVRADMDTATQGWEGSPSASVWRKPLYRQGGEFGPVTSVVRYDAGGAFRPHAHPGGEEILVLDGVFSDEHGDYPAGTYLLNPEGSVHAPRSAPGCTLLVRLRQYAGAGRRQVALETATLPWTPGRAPGVEVRWLYRQDGFTETMGIERWAPGSAPALETPDGAWELFVLEGSFSDERGTHGPGYWTRAPAGASLRAACPSGCTVYLRRGVPGDP